MTEFPPIGVSIPGPPTTLSVIDTGVPADDRPALLAIHGIGGKKEQWREQIAHFAPCYRVIAPDLHGHNQSPPINDPYTIERITDDLCNLLAVRQVRTPVTLLGHSYGGVFALHLALTHPALIERLVLIGVAEHFNYGRFFKLAAIAPVPAPLLEGGRRLLFKRKFSAPAPVMRAVVRQALLPWRGWDHLSDIQQPVLAIAGKLDVVAPPRAVDQMVRKLPNAQMRVVLNVKHKIHLQRPSKTNQLIDAFLREAT